ncbi:MAG: DUF3859 domain-containing protein [Pseudomonadota bacterium]
MKHLIPFIIVAVLTGCDRTPDTSQEPPSDSGAGDETTAAATAADTSTETQAPNDVPKGRVIRAGIFKAVHEGRLLENTSGTTGKSLKSLTLEFVKGTERIPLVKDTYLGFQYRVTTLPPELEKKREMELRRVLRHPEMLLEDGSTTTGSDYTVSRKIKLGQVNAYDAYGFHDDYELVEGEWVFQLWYRDNLLVEQKFTTYRPEESMVPVQEPSASDVGSTRQES